MTNKLHKPSTAEYGHYAYVTCFYIGSSLGATEAYEDDNKAWDAVRLSVPSFEGNFAAKETCDHCGAHFAHGVCYLHEPTNELVHVGHTCASNSFSYPSRLAALKARRVKKAAELNRAAKAKTELFAAHAGLEEAFAVDHYITKDILGRFEKWGKISEKQIALVFKLKKDDDEKEVKAAKWAAAEATRVATAEKCPENEKRFTVRGKVISIKESVGHYGWQIKMLVEDTRGFRVYGTLPTSLHDAERGDAVEFCANVARKAGGDDLYGYFSRPTKGKLLGKVEVASAA